MTDRIVRFKANASVKDIVGRGLIYDDNIAITELVKNAKDAGSPSAIITFKDEAQLSDSSSLVISDSGTGMTIDDIRDKWLNIAYSEKKGKFLNGRNAYAGNKGVGRFSCDRLGRELILYTKAVNGDYLKLPIDWERFEGKGLQDEISTIQLQYEILDKDIFLIEIGQSTFEHGTILVINKLRSEWDSRKLTKLVSELEKFSPALDDGFEVYLHSNSPHNERLLGKLNRKINNNILDKLSFKTTYIKSNIDKAGLILSTTLYYQGEEIYTYTAHNPYSCLKDISVETHYLDTLSKTYFTRNVGTSPNDYGSIFLFYNGFRISPYGNDKNDWLGLDQRKSQGTARYLGTREVFGRIDINDHDDSFSVITSREGLAHNKAFFELTAFDPEEKTQFKNGKKGYGYVTTLMRQLENFVVSGLDWNSLIDRLDPDRSKVISDSDIRANPSRYQLQAISEDKVREACNRILKSDLEIIDFKINEDLILQLTKIAEEKYSDFVEEFVKTSGNKTLRDLSSREKAQLNQIVAEEQNKTLAAIEEKAYAEEQRLAAEVKVETEKRRSSFLESLVSPEKTLDALITHVMKQISGGIEKDVKSILALYYKNPERVSKEELVETLEHIVIDVSVIKESATMATKADFNLKVATIKEDMFGFLEDYIKQIASKEKKWGLKIHFNNPQALTQVRSFQPAKLCVLLVNILDNARKAGASNLYVNCSSENITFVDDGNGFNFDTYSPDDFFRKGISTTDGGSGLGLYHCKQIASTFKARVSISNDVSTGGASINLEFS